MSWPRYKCHKVVEAVRIRSMDYSPPAGRIIHVGARDQASLPGVVVDSAWLEKHKPWSGGYLVRYEDGYLSYSPATVFEEGYTLIEAVQEEEDSSSKSYPERIRVLEGKVDWLMTQEVVRLAREVKANAAKREETP